MPVIVQKYGGSSVADVEKIQRVAARVAETRAQGKQVVVVVSAMGDTTDELLALAQKVSAGNPHRRELDMLLTAGERISMALLGLALHARGVEAVSFTGSQSGIITDGAHTNARILEVRPVRIFQELERGKVVIVAGYQGVSREKEITTLGRGGSDTTAVALAAALEAEVCEICSDVDGVYTADPRLVSSTRRLAELSHEEMQQLALAGAKVLNAQAVEFARDRGITLHARSTFAPGPGTLVKKAVSRELHRARRSPSGAGERAAAARGAAGAFGVAPGDVGGSRAGVDRERPRACGAPQGAGDFRRDRGAGAGFSGGERSGCLPRAARPSVALRRGKQSQGVGLAAAHRAPGPEVGGKGAGASTPRRVRREELRRRDAQGDAQSCWCQKAR